MSRTIEILTNDLLRARARTQAILPSSAAHMDAIRKAESAELALRRAQEAVARQPLLDQLRVRAHTGVSDAIADETAALVRVNDLEAEEGRANEKIVATEQRAKAATAEYALARDVQRAAIIRGETPAPLPELIDFPGALAAMRGALSQLQAELKAAREALEQAHAAVAGAIASRELADIYEQLYALRDKALLAETAARRGGGSLWGEFLAVRVYSDRLQLNLIDPTLPADPDALQAEYDRVFAEARTKCGRE
jgi:hypothetical protein